MDRSTCMRRFSYRKTLVQLGVVAGVLVGSLAVATQPAVAAPAYWYGYAYVWANNPASAIGAPYTPSLNYQYSSTAAQNSITRLGTGSYTVRFPYLGPYGTALVTAYGSTDDRCKISYWVGAPGVGSNTDTILYVKCFTRTGNPVNSRFTASYSHPVAGSVARAAYLWNNQPGAPIGVLFTPSPTYQYNSEGSPNTIVHSSTGTYIVHLTGLYLPVPITRQLQITAYGAPVGDPSAYCAIDSSPISDPSDGVYYIGCFNTAGARIDSSFVLTYVESGNHILAPVVSHPTAYAAVYCGESPSACGASPLYDTNPVGDITVDVINLGEYAIHMPVSLSGGNVQVAPYYLGESTRGRCKVAFWNSSDGVRVRCYDLNGGVPVNATFIVSFVK
jgi:hypothetical protein